MPIPIFELSDDELWSEYSLTKSERLRDELIKRYIPFGSKIAGHVSLSINTNICPIDDLQEAAWMAVIKCIEKFDPEFGYSEDINDRFTGYARKRVHCACIDEFRMHCWINPRTKAAKKHGIVPSSFTGFVATANNGDIDFEPSIEQNEINKMDARQLSDSSFLRNECGLDDEEMHIISSIYVHDMTQDQISEQMDISGTTVHKRKAVALEKIRNYYNRQRIDRLCAI